MYIIYIHINFFQDAYLPHVKRKNGEKKKKGLNERTHATRPLAEMNNHATARRTRRGRENGIRRSGAVAAAECGHTLSWCVVRAGNGHGNRDVFTMRARPNEWSRASRRRDKNRRRTAPQARRDVWSSTLPPLGSLLGAPRHVRPPDPTGGGGGHDARAILLSRPNRRRPHVTAGEDAEAPRYRSKQVVRAARNSVRAATRRTAHGRRRRRFTRVWAPRTEGHHESMAERW